MASLIMALAASHRYSTQLKQPSNSNSTIDDSMHYLIVTKSNKHHHKLPSSNNASKVLNEYHQSNSNSNSSTTTQSEIKCIALGKNTSYAICNSAGRARWCYFPAFSDDFKHEDRLSVQQISFGPDDTYAIVKTNGHCTHMTFGRLSDCGPWKQIEGHQGNIKYVAMTANKKQWIVGYGHNQWVAVGIDAELTDTLKKIVNNEKKEEIVSVALGKCATRWVVRSSARWYYKGDDAFCAAMKQCDDARLVAIW